MAKAIRTGSTQIKPSEVITFLAGHDCSQTAEHLDISLGKLRSVVVQAAKGKKQSDCAAYILI